MPVRVFASGVAWLALTAATPISSDLADVFGARESVEQISLSPDGSKVAYIAPRPGQGAALFTVNLADGKPVLAASVDGDPQRLSRCDWLSNSRLACRIYAVVAATELIPVTRLVALDTDGKNFKMLTQSELLNQRYATGYGGGIVDLLPGRDGLILMDRWFVPEAALKTRLASEREGYGVVRIDSRTLATTIVEEPVRFGVEFLSDGQGEIRIRGTQLPSSAAGYSGSKVKYSYRLKGSKRWEPFGEYDVTSDEGMNPFAIDPALDVAYVLQKLNGRFALYRVSLDGSLRKELVFAHPEVDVDNVIRIGRSRRPVGVSFVTDKREAIFFDPELKKLSGMLAKSLPNLPLIRFVDASADESKLLLWVGSDTDPGRYMLYNKTNRKLDEVLAVRPQLEGVKLSPVQSVSYKASDGTMVPAYLTLPPGGAKARLPAIVMPHGGPSARDEWGFDWLSQYFAAKGYAVLQPNFRGSSGYGDAWFQNNGFQSWRVAIGDVNDAGRWLVSQGIADGSKLAIVGWSYGGYAALQSGVVDPGIFKAVVAVAPVTDLAGLKEESRNWSNHVLANRFIGSGPHIREGSPAENVASLRAPVLLFHGNLDRNVGINQSRRMADRLRSAGKKVELVVYPKLDHYLEDSKARADMLRKSDSFLRSAMGL